MPIALFSIPLCLAGVVGAWSTASQLLGASDPPADVAYAASTFVYLAFTAMYVVGALCHEGGGSHLPLRHALFGPLTAYLPVVAGPLIVTNGPASEDDRMAAAAVFGVGIYF